MENECKRRGREGTGSRLGESKKRKREERKERGEREWKKREAKFLLNC